jgi:hypothetical protein
MINRVLRDEIIKNIRDCVIVEGKPSEQCVDDVLDGDPRLSDADRMHIRRAIER